MTPRFVLMDVEVSLLEVVAGFVTAVLLVAGFVAGTVYVWAVMGS